MVTLSDLTLRKLETPDEYKACVRLQRETWGQNFLDIVPATILMVAQRVGGVTAGAFDANGRLLGFVFGMSGVRDGELVHWSDMLAVRSEVRGLGLGKRIKLFQRELLLKQDIQVAYWTYDPLVSRNANLNLNGLGAVPVEYLVNMYGNTGGTLHRGLDTDRFIVEWRLTASHVERALTGKSQSLPPAALEAPVVNSDAITGESPHVQSPSLPTTDWVRIVVPLDIDQVKVTALDDARLWQLMTRHAFQWYLAHGYRVSGFQPVPDAGHAYYFVTNQAEL